MLAHHILENIVSICMNFVFRSVYAHGGIMSIAFVLLFPLSALTIRLFHFKGIVWVHAGLQLFAFAVALSGFGLGLANAIWQERVSLLLLD